MEAISAHYTDSWATLYICVVCISVIVSVLLCPSVGGSREITSVLVGLVEAGRLGGGQRRPEPLSPLEPQQPPHSDLSNNTSSYNNTGGEDGGRLGCNLTITLLLTMDHINSTPAPVPQYFPGISS